MRVSSKRWQFRLTLHPWVARPLCKHVLLAKRRFAHHPPPLTVCTPGDRHLMIFLQLLKLSLWGSRTRPARRSAIAPRYPYALDDVSPPVLPFVRPITPHFFEAIGAGGGAAPRKTAGCQDLAMVSPEDQGRGKASPGRPTYPSPFHLIILPPTTLDSSIYRYYD